MTLDINAGGRIDGEHRAQRAGKNRFDRKIRVAIARRHRPSRAGKHGADHDLPHQGIGPRAVRHLYGASDAALRAEGVERHIVTATPGFPDRIEVRDADLGARVLLLNHGHQPARNPYRASHTIFVREGAERACDLVDDVPQAIRVRPISLRAFDGADVAAPIPRENLRLLIGGRELVGRSVPVR